MSTEARFEAHIIGYELYAYSSGHVIIGITKFSACGQSLSCSDYFDNFGNNYAEHILFSNKYDIQKGYNQLGLCQQEKIPKGSLVFISIGSNSTAKFYIDDSVSSSDYQKNKIEFIPIASLSNKRVLLNTLFAEQDYFEYAANFYHLFPSYEIFNLNFIFKNNEKLFTFKKNATVEIKKSN